MTTPRVGLPDGKECTGCQQFKLRECYSLDRGRRDQMQTRCKDCQKVERRQSFARNPERQKEHGRLWYERNKERRKVLGRDQHLRRKYGLTLEKYDEILASQGGHCAICPSTKRLVVDHCHVRGQVRSILCDDCNIALGRFRDDPDLLRRAAAYLEQHHA